MTEYRILLDCFFFSSSTGEVKVQKRDTSTSCQPPIADRPVTGKDHTPDMLGACQNKGMTTDVDSLMHIKNKH